MAKKTADRLTGFVREYIEKQNLIQTGDLIVVGLSGGEDSVCLLSVLRDLAGEMGFSLSAVHVHHGLRGTEADADMEFCRRLCRDWEIPFEGVRVDVAGAAAREKRSLEEAARMERYRVLEEWREKGKASRIAVAHHRRDEAETVLWNLFRGTGLKGLAGMEPANGCVIRPFLDVPKERIREYMEERSLPWRQDSTNGEEGCTRNRLRLRLLPYVEEEINRQAVSHICQAARTAGKADRYLRGQAERWLEQEKLNKGERKREETGREVCLNARRLIGEEEILQEYIVRLACEKVGGLTDISARHVEAVLSLLEGRRGAAASREVRLAGQIRVRNSYGQLIFTRGQEASPSQTGGFGVPEPETYPARICLGGKIAELRVFSYDKMQEIPTNQYTKWLDYDKIERPLIFRTRRPGDYFYLAGGGRKSVKAYMIDQKIPAKERDGIAVAACGSHVMWIDGRRLDERVKITEDTKVVLQIKVYGGEKDGEDSCIDS